MIETLEPRTAWRLLPLVAVDVEGNGARPAGLVEIAVVPISGGEIGAVRTWLVKPSSPITWQATRVHGITDAHVAGCEPASAIAHDVLVLLGENAVVVAHNAHVDLDVLGREFPGFTPGAVIGTLKLSRRLHPERSGHKLGDLVTAYGLDGDVDSLGALTGQATAAEPDTLF